MTPQITPFIWFDADPYEVRDFYAGIFDDFETLSDLRGPDGKVLGVSVRIGESQYNFFNGGPGHPHSDAFSLMIYTDDQEQTDRYWTALIADGGEESVCGWLKDKFGVNWQVTPRLMMDVLAGDDAEGRRRAFDAMLGMRKMFVDELQAAYARTTHDN
ncbi:MAG: VOC family protein [Actinobacteria bacterium]|nr:VOC family protein [Actinomycetota bacterium]